MPRFDTVAILGVGLIGGSIGLGLLRRRLASRVIGIGRRPESLRVAMDRGAVTPTTLRAQDGVTEADLVIVCTPVGRIVNDVRSIAPHCRPAALVTDVGSTKGEIVAGVGASLPNGVRFLGSHPIAGSERSGPAAAEADLFAGRVVIVTPTEATGTDDLEAICDFWRGLEARVVQMPADEHDRALAATSHLPHLVAAALATATPKELLGLTAGGWADCTRIAAGDPNLWRQIFASNRESLLASLERFEGCVAAFRQAIERHDDAALLERLATAQHRRDALD